jgi:transcriptional regulator with XRE-family HTH domain
LTTTADAFRTGGNPVAKRIRKRQGSVVEDFANRLRECRRKRGLSQMKLAAKAGVNLSYLNKLERAEATPGLDVIARLAEALGVAASELVSPPGKSDPLPAMRQQALRNLEAAIAKSDRTVLEMLAMLGSLVDNALSRNR